MSTLEFNQALMDLETNLVSFALTFTKNLDDAKDLTQETFLKAIRYRKYYTPKTNFKAWTFTIMKNIFINQYRRKVKSKTIFDHTKDSFLINNNSSSEKPNNIFYKKEIENYIQKLDNEYKIPFNLHMEGFKYKEIADKLNIPIGTVKSRIFIARKKLMKSLPEYTFSSN